ncbi:MAG TPA: hypothetical protein IAB69_01845 [Candidatus Coproplasma excrementigallinarum]|uniref:Uncharacterized protein n=1 Tax=Candidatus Coproplasma excrementigallinarum TaxID=2840747 RepID=A0A9D1MJR0_9FIRM|nr:hypothetical protein [Candidatus Coproplasma excrementigallinarum]
MWWPFKSKYDKLKREDVVDAICNLEKQESDIESAIEERARTIEELLAKGRKEGNRELKLFYAKKITSLREENQAAVKRAMYLMYNMKLLNKLKTTIDDNSFFIKTGKISLGNLLSDQKGLAQFLNKALNTRVRSEQVLTDADDTWNEVQSGYEENERIYGVNEHDDELLAMFETGEQLDAEMGADGAKQEEKKPAADTSETGSTEDM